MVVQSGSVAVVVATRNRAVELEATLERLRALPERPQVVVVDNASGDGTALRVRRHHPQVEVVELRENLGAAARTVGALHTTSRYVAFSDDDSWWAPGSLERAAELLDRHPRLALVAARVLVGPNERLDPVCAAMASSPLAPTPDLPGRPVLGFVACGAVVRRSASLQAAVPAWARRCAACPGCCAPVARCRPRSRPTSACCDRPGRFSAARGWSAFAWEADSSHGRPGPSAHDAEAGRRR